MPNWNETTFSTNYKSTRHYRKEDFEFCNHKLLMVIGNALFHCMRNKFCLLFIFWTNLDMEFGSWDHILCFHKLGGKF
jgi:hypothetical protein